MSQWQYLLDCTQLQHSPYQSTGLHDHGSATQLQLIQVHHDATLSCHAWGRLIHQVRLKLIFGRLLAHCKSLPHRRHLHFHFPQTKTITSVHKIQMMLHLPDAYHIATVPPLCVLRHDSPCPPRILVQKDIPAPELLHSPDQDHSLCPLYFRKRPATLSRYDTI